MGLRTYRGANVRGLEPNPAEIVRIPLDRVHIGATLRQSGENARHVAALSEVAAALPPIVVHRPSMTVIDGAHRVRAAQCSGSQWIDAVYFDGDDGQALLLAIRLNTAHGLPLSAADRKAAAEQVLMYYPDWSDRRLGMALGLSERTIAAVRRRTAVLPTCQPRPCPTPVAAPGEIHRRPERIPQADSRPIQRCSVPAAGADQPSALRTSDPALHRTESGRQLLDLLATIPADPATWAELIGDLPAYHAAFLAELAAEQAENWSALARAATRHAVTEENTAA
ncbi:ParB N-terminal domain-containing protein [Nocardia sp. NPDC056611]|uniref:ParB N-terminal domain-containing protein n=1 Tax=unclassified Nocardia TaxID=2637762 RepID=UPI003670728C